MGYSRMRYEAFTGLDVFGWPGVDGFEVVGMGGGAYRVVFIPSSIRIDFVLAFEFCYALHSDLRTPTFRLPTLARQPHFGLFALRLSTCLALIMPDLTNQMDSFPEPSQR